RGTPLEQAETVFEGATQDVWAGAWAELDHGIRYEFASTAPTFFTSKVWLRRGDEWLALDKPDDAELSTFGAQLLIRLKTPWSPAGREYPAGALLAIALEDFLAGGRDFALLFDAGGRTALDRFAGPAACL